MTCLLILLTHYASPFNTVRDSYGVPRIEAASVRQAWADAGYAVAQDRLWQMETSRHLARGSLASILGRSALASDIEVANNGYTDAELQAQFDHLSVFAKTAITAYAEGVNRYLRTQTLSPEFATHDDKPTPWTVLDSVAITVRLFQEFGKGGAGELRNLAFIQYAKSQPKLKERVLDALDDFAWQNDPAAVTTIADADDVNRNHPPTIFPIFDRSTSETRLKEIPIPGMFELLSGLRLAERSDSHLIAECMGVPYRTGSYCVVVAPKLSSNGSALLMSGPQMGLKTPSVLHEISIHAPGLDVTGADVPGVPGVVVGKTSAFAWGVTSGVADTEDIVWSRLSDNGYVHNRHSTPFSHHLKKIEVKGSEPVMVDAKWTAYGPVVLESKSSGVVFSRHSAYRGVEMRSFDALLSTYDKSSATDVDREMASATMNFNYFYATSAGDIGYRYVGRIPRRASGLDPRLPTPDESQYAWKGFVPPAQMPHVMNPSNGLLANWNNKPTSWFPNGDTPAWGRIHEANSLFEELHAKVYSSADLKRVVERIAKKDATWPFFKDLAPSLNGGLVKPEGWPTSYERWFGSLRQVAIEPTAGGFLNPDIFKLVAQPTVVWNAVHSNTKLDFLQGRTPSDLAQAALALTPPFELPLGTLPVNPYKEDLEFRNRGTYIQIVSLSPQHVVGVSVLPPGESATGLNSRDQLPLAKLWDYKPMW